MLRKFFSSCIQFHHTTSRTFSKNLRVLSEAVEESSSTTPHTSIRPNPVFQFFKHLNPTQLQKLISQFMELAESEGYFSKNIRNELLDEQNKSKLQQFLLYTFGTVNSENILFVGRETVRLCIADYLFAHFPYMESEQKMNIILQLSKPEYIIKVARQNLRLNEFLEKQSSSKFERSDYEQYMSNLFYRMVGALQLQFGLLFARDFVVRHLLRKSSDITSLVLSFDPKVELANKISSGIFKANNIKQGQTISYDVQHVDAQHQRKTGAAFTANVFVGNVLLGSGQGPTRTIAEMKAAEDALFKYFCKFEDSFTPIQREYLQKE